MKPQFISNKITLLVSTAILLIASVELHAENLRKIVQLNGKWKFSIGDDKKWAEPGYYDSDWDEIVVPSKWEDQGYNDYNGYAWYRKTFIISSFSSEGPVYLELGRIDDADEVYLNGRLIGKRGSFPPNYKTAYDQARKYSIPHGLLKIDGKNTIAIKVYDEYLEGGIIDGPVGIYVDEDYDYLDMTIDGKWKFHLGDNKQWCDPAFDDAEWTDIEVPAEWENEGFQDYDGYAWYRKKFNVPASLVNDNLYLSLGKIDDYDYVYLNGKLIGSVFDLNKDSEYRRKGYEYNARRTYKIPENLLKTNSVNVLAVRVYDEKWRGGIYEGPIGIMKEDNYKKYSHKNYSNQPFWDYFIEEFMMD